MIDRWLMDFERQLRVHGRRRRRIVEELAWHLRESAASHGEYGAVARVGDAGEVARSFTPRVADRAFEQRDRLAALTMLAAMLGSLPLAADLQGFGDQAGSYAWLWFFLFLTPTAAVAFISCLAVLRRHALGVRLARPLLAMVLVTAVAVVLDLPPVTAAFRDYRESSEAATITRLSHACAGSLNCPYFGAYRDASAVASDHASEIRINYSAGAIVLSLVYLWAVTGWTPRRRRPQNALA